MSNSDHRSKGFFRRIFQRNNPPADEPSPVSPPASPSASQTQEIAMVPAGERASGKRLPKAKSVLMIVADDALARRWRRELEEWGYGVELTDDGQKGLDILYGFSFDALLLDHTAPKVDGVDLLHQIRSHEELKTMFIGAFARDKSIHAEQELAAIEAGANRVFQRSSVKSEEILTALKTALFPRTLQVQPRAKTAPAGPTPAPVPDTVVPFTAPGAGSSVPSVPMPAAGPRPIQMTAPAAPDAPVRPAPASPNKKLLIIDADESVAGIYRSQIEAAGYEVEVALDGETGFHDLYTTNPDALLLDLLLPGGLSGSEILKKTRAQKKFEKIPILVFTNIYTRDIEEEAKAAGVLRLFNKAAATPKDVVEALNEIFLPSGAVFGGAAAPASIKFDMSPPTSSSASGGRQAAEVAQKAVAAADDGDFQTEIRESLLQGAPDYVKSLRGLLQVLLRTQGDPGAQATQLLELYTRVHSLTANAAIAGFPKVARLAGALEAMLREFQAKPEGLNASTKRTLTQAMDFLALLFTSAATHESGKPLEEKILVVDDEIISRRVIGHSLEKAGLKSSAVSHPDEALKLLQEQPYDLVFLDVEMPGMNGFELCKRLRAMPLHAKTPVIFVTALSGFESRAKSSLSGGDDFIGKPFSYIELAVKGLIYVLRGSLGEEGAAARPRTPVAVASSADPVAVAS